VQEVARERRLAATLAADVVGCSRLIRADEEGAIAAFRAMRAGPRRASVINPVGGSLAGARGTGTRFYAELTIALASAISHIIDLGQAEAELRSPDGKGRAFVV